MKRSLFSTNNSYSTQLTQDNTRKDNVKLEIIID